MKLSPTLCYGVWLVIFIVYFCAVGFVLSVPPSITNPERLLKIDENTPVGTNIIRLSATPVNSSNQFSLTSDDNIDNYFNVDSANGDIILIKPLNYKERPYFIIYAIVTSLTTGETAKAQFSIQVLKTTNPNSYKPSTDNQDITIKPVINVLNMTIEKVHNSTNKPNALPVIKDLPLSNTEMINDESANNHRQLLPSEELFKMQSKATTLTSTEVVPTRRNTPLGVSPNARSSNTNIMHNNSELPISIPTGIPPKEPSTQNHPTITSKPSNLGSKLSYNLSILIGFVTVLCHARITVL